MTRDPEWDDFEREKMLALAEFEAGICDCNLHRSVADADPDLNLLLPVCPVCADLARSLRVIAAEDDAAVKQLGEKPPPDARRPDDGRRVALAPVAPTT